MFDNKEFQVRLLHIYFLCQLTSCIVKQGNLEQSVTVFDKYKACKFKYSCILNSSVSLCFSGLCWLTRGSRESRLRRSAGGRLVRRSGAGRAQCACGSERYHVVDTRSERAYSYGITIFANIHSLCHPFHRFVKCFIF